jgi:hypothetical protein
MDLFNFGRQQLNNGSLNNMLEQVGIDDVGSFVNQFRNQAKQEASVNEDDSEDFESTGGSSANQVNQKKINEVIILSFICSLLVEKVEKVEIILLI